MSNYRLIAVLTIALGAAPWSIAGEQQERAAEKNVISSKESNVLSWKDRVKFDFEERIRWEVRDNNFDFNDDVNALTDDNWFLQRARVGVLFTLSDWVRVYGQAQDSREINSDRPDFPGLLAAEGDDSIDLRQAWVEFGNPKEFPLTVKAGRQLLSYGDERLVGSFDWSNFGRTFDAVRLRWEEDRWALDAFASTVVAIERGSYNQSDLFNGRETDRDQVFSGLYFQTTLIPFQATDLYVLHLHENGPEDLATDTDTDFFTFGARVKSQPGAFTPRSPGLDKHAPSQPRPVGLDYDAEFAFQAGEVGGSSLRAFAGHAAVGYTFDTAWLPRIALGYSYATGDDEPGDDDVQTFQNLFPTNHKFYGQMDLFSWQNLHDLEVNFKVQPIRQVTVRLDFHAFWLETTEDAWYRANGVTRVRPINAGSRAAGNYVGSEVDLIVTWAVNKHLQLEGGYSHFFAGDYLEGTGSNDDADFGYLQAKVTF